MAKKIEIYVVYMGVYVAAMTFTIVFPFANEMVMSFGATSDKDKTGLYVGLMTSSLMFGRALFCPLWGYIVDSWGRKKVTQLSLISIAVLSLVFGSTRNFLFATFVRFLIGVLSPLNISSRTMIGALHRKRTIF
jgi:MFS family permease